MIRTENCFPKKREVEKPFKKKKEGRKYGKRNENKRLEP